MHPEEQRPESVAFAMQGNPHWVSFSSIVKEIFLLFTEENAFAKEDVLPLRL